MFVHFIQNLLYLLHSFIFHKNCLNDVHVNKPFSNANPTAFLWDVNKPFSNKTNRSAFLPGVKKPVLKVNKTFSFLCKWTLLKCKLTTLLFHERKDTVIYVVFSLKWLFLYENIYGAHKVLGFVLNMTYYETLNFTLDISYLYVSPTCHPCRNF